MDDGGIVALDWLTRFDGNDHSLNSLSVRLSLQPNNQLWALGIARMVLGCYLCKTGEGSMVHSLRVSIFIMSSTWHNIMYIIYISHMAFETDWCGPI